MGKCSVCGEKILYNKFKRYRGKVLCYDCYDKRLERKEAKKKKAEAKQKTEDIEKTAERLYDPLMQQVKLLDDGQEESEKA